MNGDLNRNAVRGLKLLPLEELRRCWEDLFPEFREGSSPAEALPRRFQDHDLNAQQAGWLFEHWICEAFRLVGETVLVDDSFTVPSLFSDKVQEELDGLVTVGWQGLVIQCKLESNPTPFDPIARLHLQVERRPQGTLGLFFSRAYSDSAIELASELRPIRVLLFRAGEIDWELKKEQSFDMLKLVRKKWHGAVKYAKPDYELNTVSKEFRGL
jgi:hypothetical protein